MTYAYHRSCGNTSLEAQRRPRRSQAFLVRPVGLLGEPNGASIRLDVGSDGPKDALDGYTQILKTTEYPEIKQIASHRDVLLYTLGIGLGADPLDLNQLKYVYEKELGIFPTMAITLCYPASLGARPGVAQVDLRKRLHVFQGFELLNPNPLDRSLIGRTKITNVFDKGAKRGIL
jgi:hypothetical protein